MHLRPNGTPLPDRPTLSSGRVKIGKNSMQACITIPGNIGEVCAPF